MKNRPVHIDLPLEELFRRLEAAGFATDTARRLRLLQLLHREGLAQAGRWDDLKYRLAPFVARNAQEQERFYALMDEMQAAWAADWAAELEQPAGPPPALSPTPSRPMTYARLAAWAALVLLLGLCVWWLWPKGPPFIEPLRFNVAEGDTVLLKGVNADPEEMRWVLLDRTTRDTLVKASGTDTLSWLASGAGRHIEGRLYKAEGDTSRYYAQIQCAVPPKPTVTIPSGVLDVGVPYTFKAEAEEGVLFSWRMDYEDTLSGASVTDTFDAPGIYPILLRAARSGEERYCAYEETFSIAVGTNTPNLPTAPLKRDAPTAAARLHWAYWLLPLLALWLALALWRRWRERRRPEPPAEVRAEDYPIHDLAPYYIPYLPQEDKISVSRDFFRIADVLRRREEAPRRRFDAGASVRATVEAGGYPSWRERAETQPVRWLLLVEQPDERSQASRLLLRLAHFLVKLEAPAEVWTHDGRFGRFYSPDAPEGLSAAELHRRCPGHRLVLLGEAQGLAHPYEASLLPQPLAALKRWPRRLLLTPAAPADWGLHEALLHQHFWLHPADTAGAWAGFDQADRLEEHEPTPFEAWRQACCRLHTDAPARRRAWDSPQDHCDYLPDAAHYRWLCALAVCTQPDWALTAALGRAVGAPVSHDSLLRLARIPWLDANAPVTALRLALLRELSPQDEAAARLALAEELERVRKAVAGSFAQTEWTTQLAVQRFALAPHHETHKQSLRKLLDLGLLSGDQLAELDYIVAERIDRQGLPDAAFADLAAWLAQPAPPRPRPRELAAALLATLAALGLLVYGALAARLHPEAPWVSRAPVYDLAAELNNQAVGHWKAADSLAASGGWARGWATSPDSLLEQALLRRQPAYYALADSNRSALRYNAGALGLGRYYGPARDTAALAEACDWLARVPERPWPDLYLAARHGLGLCGYYRADSATALAAYRELLARTQGQYFDSISPQQPVNLRSLLLAEGWLAPPNMTTLSGELRDSSTNAPLSGGSVRSGSYAATTDAAGRYTLSLPANPTGRYRLQYEAPGYLGRSATLAAGSGGRLPLLRLARAQAAVRGTVLDSLSGQPLPEVLVSGPDGQTTRTDAAGRYALPLPSRPAPAYELRFSREGYAPLLRRLPARAEAKVLMRRLGLVAALRQLEADMVQVPGGTFTMGCQDGRDTDCYDDEKPPHQVTLTTYYISKYEVTQAQWRAVMSEDPTDLFNKGCDICPVENVSWDDIQIFLQRLNALTGKRYRLPTEAEWEYAARGGSRTKGYVYSGSNDLNKVGWFYDNYSAGNTWGERRTTRPVGGKKPNELGLYDMSGNVWEWCEDDWHSNYEGAPEDGRAWVDVPERRSNRVYRGGSWSLASRLCRVADRFSWQPNGRNSGIGFRLASSLPR